MEGLTIPMESTTEENKGEWTFRKWDPNVYGHC